ncbi:MAG: TRAP transporter small permease [Faecalibacterium sp.]
MDKINAFFKKLEPGYPAYKAKRDKIMNIYSNVGAVMLAILACSVTFAVVMRYLFSLSWLWLSECNVILFAWSTFWGLAACIWKEEHVAIDMLYATFNPAKKKKFAIINYSIVLVVLLFLAYALSVYVSVAGSQQSPGIILPSGQHLPMIFVYAMMPFAAVVSILVTIDKIVEFIMRPVESFATPVYDPEAVTEGEGN